MHTYVKVTPADDGAPADTTAAMFLDVERALSVRLDDGELVVESEDGRPVDEAVEDAARANTIAAVDSLCNAGNSGDEVVVVQAVRAVYGRLPVTDRIPHESQPGRDVVPVTGECVGRRIARDAVGDIRPRLHLVANADLRRQTGRNAPVVLREQREVAVGIRRRRIAVSLHVAARNAQLHGHDRRHLHRWQPELRRRGAGDAAEDIASAEMQRQALVGRVDVTEIEARFELMRPREIAHGIEDLVALVPARLRGESLPPDAGNAKYFERRAALILLRARAAAPRVE